MAHRKFGFLLVVFLLAIGLLPVGVAAFAPGEKGGEDYIFQVDDHLGRLAEKYYGDRLAYPAIVEATNAKAGQNETYTPVTDPTKRLVGHKLFVPAMAEVPKHLLAEAPLPKYTGSQAWTARAGLTAQQRRLLAQMDVVGTPPELHNQVWLNSGPLKLAELHGKVVIVEFWTFG